MEFAASAPTADLLKKAEPPTLNLALTLSTSSSASASPIPALPTTASSAVASSLSLPPSITSSASSSLTVSPTSHPLTPASPSSTSSSLSTSPSALSLVSTPTSLLTMNPFSPVSTVADTADVHAPAVPSASSASSSLSASSTSAVPETVIVTIPEYPSSRPTPLNTGDEPKAASSSSSSSSASSSSSSSSASASSSSSEAGTSGAAAGRPAPLVSPNILNRHNLPFPAHYTPSSLIWAERPFLSTATPRALHWPAEVLDLEVKPEGSRLKVRYLGPPAHLAIISGEQCKPFVSAEYDRLAAQSGEKDFTQAVAAAVNLVKERREAKEKVEVGDDGAPLTPSLSPSTHRPSINSPGNIGVGTRIRLRSADIIHHKLKEYAGTEAEIMEVPSHPNTWFGVRLMDGKEIKIRKSAFDVTSSPGEKDASSMGGGQGSGGHLGLGHVSAFTSLLGGSSSSSPMGSVSSTPRSHLSDFSRMSTPFLFNMAPPFTPLPVSPGAFHPSFNPMMLRPLIKGSLVRITLTPDTQPFPSLVGKEAQVIAIEDGNQYLIRLKDLTTVKLHRMSLQSLDDDPMAMGGLVPPIFNFGFNTPMSVKGAGQSSANAAASQLLSASSAERPNTAESANSELSNATVASTPKAGDKDGEKANADGGVPMQTAEGEANAKHPAVGETSAQPESGAEMLATPVKSPESIAEEAKDAANTLLTPTASASLGLADTRPSTASSSSPPSSAALDNGLQAQQAQMMQQMQMHQMMAMQQMYLQHVLASNPAIAPFLPFPIPQPLTPITPMSMVGSLVSILSGEHTGQQAIIAGINDHSVLLKLKDSDTDCVKRFSEITLVQPPPSMTGGAAPGAATLSAAAADGAAGAGVSQATEVNSPSAMAVVAGGPASAAPTMPFQLPFLPGLPGMALPGMANMPGLAGMPYFYPPSGRMRNPLKHRSLKNLVGKYVMVLSGPYKNEMGMVLKGSNGYFSVRLSRQFADLKEHGGVVMKRSGDLKVLDLTQASFELMKMQMRDEEAKAQGAADRTRWMDNAKAQADDASSSEDSDTSNSDSNSDSDSDSDSDDSNNDAKDGAAKPRNGDGGARKKRKRTSTSSSSSSSTSPSPGGKKASFGGRINHSITSTPIPASIKPESLIDSLVVVRKGRCKGEVGTVKRSGHGFYCLNILHRGEVMKRANELELINAGGAGLAGAGGVAGKSSALTPRRLGRVGEAVKAAVAQGPEAVKGGMTGNLRDAASLLMDLMGESPEEDEDDESKKKAKKQSKSKPKRAKVTIAPLSSSSSSSTSKVPSSSSSHLAKPSSSSSSSSSSKKKKPSKPRSKPSSRPSPTPEDDAEDDSDLSVTSSDSDDDMRGVLGGEGAKRGKAGVPVKADDTESDEEGEDVKESGAGTGEEGRSEGVGKGARKGVKAKEAGAGTKAEVKADKEEGRAKRVRKEISHK